MESFKIFNPEKKNFTPSKLIRDYAIEHALPTKMSPYGKTLISIKGVWHEYDHYELEDVENGENVSVFLVPYTTGCYGVGSYECLNLCPNCD